MNWFTSDHHWNHTNILGYCARPFSSMEEMNEVMIERWNERISDSDTVYHIGDVFLGRPDNAIEIVRRLKGHKILISGNHDRSRKTMIECGFNEVCNRKDFTLKNGKLALLCHKPQPESVIKSYDLQIHGHRHNGAIVSGKRLNVCVDLWNFFPISEDEICNIELQPPHHDSVQVNVIGDMVEIKALVKKEDIDGLLDHLAEYTRNLRYTRDS